MSSFTEHSHIKPHWKQWINTKAFRFYHEDSKKGLYDEVQKNFVYDWCSVPFCIFWQKIEPDTLTSCCYHDWLFSTKKYWFYKSNYLFLVAMRVDWVSWFKRFKYWLWVTLFGWIVRNFTWEFAKKNRQK